MFLSFDDVQLEANVCFIRPGKAHDVTSAIASSRIALHAPLAPTPPPPPLAINALTPMPRRAHRKSRYGCDNCRRRRVKCDEQGPPCTNCILRQLEDCIYSRVQPASLATNSQRPCQVTVPPSPITLAPAPVVDELELMHQFATDTYQSLCVSESESTIWQKLVPRLALKNRHLMHGILALASLHIATTLDPSTALIYVDTGLEYHSRSLEPFRAALDNVTAHNCDAMFAGSIVTTAINLALPQFKPLNSAGMTENIITVFKLLQGVKKILTIGQSWINLELFSQGDFWNDTRTLLDEDTDAALRQLAALNERTTPEDCRINRDVISHLQHCFMKFSCSPGPAPVLAWLAAVNYQFVDSLRQRKSFSLVILAHWGLLLGQLDGQRWWARNAGRALVSELLGALEGQELLWGDCLAWLRRRLATQSLPEQSTASAVVAHQS